MSVAAVEMKDDLGWTESQKGLVLVSATFLPFYVSQALYHLLSVLSVTTFIFHSLLSTGAMLSVSCPHLDLANITEPSGCLD